MFKVTIEGREFGADSFGDQLKAEVVRLAREEIEAQVRAALASLRCPQHGIPVTEVRVKFDGGDSGSVETTPCCDAMRSDVERAVTAALAEE